MTFVFFKFSPPTPYRVGISFNWDLTKSAAYRSPEGSPVEIKTLEGDLKRKLNFNVDVPIGAMLLRV